MRAKKFAGGAAKNENTTNQELAEKLRKPIIRKFEKCILTFYRQFFGC